MKFLVFNTRWNPILPWNEKVPESRRCPVRLLCAPLGFESTSSSKFFGSESSPGTARCSQKRDAVAQRGVLDDYESGWRSYQNTGDVHSARHEWRMIFVRKKKLDSASTKKKSPDPDKEKKNVWIITKAEISGSEKEETEFFFVSVVRSKTKPEMKAGSGLRCKTSPWVT